MILCFLAGTILSGSVAPAQSSQPRREPDVPYVPTTEEAVQAMLKLAVVTKNTYSSPTFMKPPW